jgi:hypothetical protein
LGRASDLGVITAVFFRESTPRPHPVTPPPYYEPRPRDRSGAPNDEETMRAEGGERKSRNSAGATAARPPRADDDYAATGIGRSVGHDVTWIQMPLQRTPAGELTVRYEYRDALVKLGLLPRPWRDDALRRRERARGFEEPRYSPEPPR